MIKSTSTGAVLGTALFLCLQLALVTYEARVLTGLLGSAHALVAQRVALLAPGQRG